jgi:antitoxin MazE
MVTTVAKWGNGLAVRIPPHVIREIHLTEGTEVDLVVIDYNLMITSRLRKRYSLEELTTEITPKNVHSEVGTGIAQGNKAW